MDNSSENKKFDFLGGSVLVLNKPYRWTSFDVVNQVKLMIARHFNIKKKSIKVGHAGTLDPLATGLLIICTGSMTKRIHEFQDLEKEYTGTFTVGKTTPSFDLETETDCNYPVDHISHDLIYSTTEKFIGTIAQQPPIFSAKKVDGKKAYLKARKGKPIELKSAEVTITQFQITEIELPEIKFKVVCSKGTYIRSLANDYGKALQSGAHLSVLCRERIGQFTLKDAISVDTLKQLLPL
jgi:tRNA pseudouridine55 synthase